MRGEHAVLIAGQDYREGSSPHARGALDPAEKLTETPGIIPACAGSTVTYLQFYQMLILVYFTFLTRRPHEHARS